MKMFVGEPYPFNKALLLILFLSFYILGEAQLFPNKNYPKGYFIYPVNAKIGIAANFGELRPNHYHMGLDCRTNHVQNRPVLAAADGYVAHIRIITNLRTKKYNNSQY